MARKSLINFIHDYGHRSDVNISIGLRPSGVIHLGNMMTMSLAVALAREIGPHLSQVNVAICDFDLPDVNDWVIEEKGYALTYDKIPDPEGKFISMSDKASVSIENFFNKMKDYTSVSFSLSYLSDIQRDARFREGLKKVLDDPNSMNLILPKLSGRSVLVYPHCPICQTVYTGNKKGKKVIYENGKIHSFCSNSDCMVEEFDIELLDSEKDFSVHMFIDPLRDALVPPLADIHVYGGDYSQKHGSNKISKIDKISELTKIASEGKVPDYLIGPTIYSRDGCKMSKTASNGLTTDILEKHLGENYPHKILDFTEELVLEGFKHIDYPLIAQRLLHSGGRVS